MGLRAEHATALDGYVRALTGDRSARAVFADDYDETYPQSGERIVGGSNALIAIGRQPDPMTVVGSAHFTSCGDDHALLEALLDYGGTPWWVVVLFEIHGSRLHHATAYFAPPFDAPAWRAEWAERYDPLDPAEWAGEGDGAEVDRAGFERLLRDSLNGRYDLMGPTLDPDYRGSFPQSGERFDARAMQAVDEHYPGGLPEMQPTWAQGETERWIVNPGNVPIRVSGWGDTWAGEILLHYPSGERYHGLAVEVFRGGRLWRQRFYYFAPFEAASFRTDLVQRFDPETALG